MSNYDTFALFYDALTENVDYEARSAYISGFFLRYGVLPGCSVLDLACGTGSVTKCLSDMGYKMRGVDLSEEMLTVAKNKCPDTEFFCCDMTEYRSEKQFEGCVCCLDSINHLQGIEQVRKCFSTVATNLVSGGIFIFDVNTLYKHRCVLADRTFVFDEEDFFLSWDNEAVDDCTVRIMIDIFCFNGKNYDRLSDEFTETAYDIETLKKSLDDFEVLGIYDELTEDEPKEDSQRLYFVCKRK